MVQKTRQKDVKWHISNRLKPAPLQKDAFYNAKGYLLQHERLPFATQNMTF